MVGSHHPRIRTGHDATEPGKIGVVDPHDAAAVSVIALTQPGHVGHGYFITGPEALSPSELTTILSDVLGRPLEFIASTPEKEAQRSIDSGTPPNMAAARQNLDELFVLSRAGIITDDVYNLTGNPPRSFRTWVQNHTAAFA